MATRKRKILFGCAFGCGALLLLSVGSCVGFTVWLNRPGELLETHRLVSPSTTGLIELNLRMEDPGTEQFVLELIEASRLATEEAGKEVPAVVRELLLDRQQRKNERQLKKALPLTVSWSMYAGDRPEKDVHLISLSVEKMGNRLSLADWMMGLVFRLSPTLVAVRHADERIYTIEPGHDNPEGAVFVRDKDLFLASSLDGAKRAVDLLRGEAISSYSPTFDVDSHLAELPDLPLRGAISNERGEAYRVWMRLMGAEDEARWQEEPWSGIRGLLVSGGFAADTSFEGWLEFVCKDAEWAEAHARDFEGKFRFSDERGDTGVTIEPEAIGNRIRIGFAAEDLGRWLDHVNF